MEVGWSLSNRMTADIVVNALKNAKAQGYVAKMLPFIVTEVLNTLSAYLQIGYIEQLFSLILRADWQLS